MLASKLRLQSVTKLAILPCHHVRCSFLTKCRKRHLGDMASENATSQMRTYTCGPASDERTGLSSGCGAVTVHRSLEPSRVFEAVGPNAHRPLHIFSILIIGFSRCHGTATEGARMIEQNTLRRRGTGLIAADPAVASAGFTLFAPLTGTGQVYLVDLDGVPVHRWDMPYRPGRYARILPGGNLAYNGTLPGGPALFPMWHKYHGGALCEVAPDGTILREHRDDLHHHDAHHFGDGRILYSAVEPLTAASARAVPGGVPGSEAEGPGGTVYAATSWPACAASPPSSSSIAAPAR
jgi:hypothetical protein